MSRFAIKDSSAPQPTFEGDSQLTGVNMKMPRDQLPPGMVARGENKRFTHGAATRPGTRTPTFANGYPAEVFFGSGVYSDPNGFEMGLLCGASHVIAIRAGTAPVSIPIEAAQLPISGKVEFSQQFDKVLLHRDDPSKPTLIWDGETSSTPGFVPVVSSIPEGADVGIVAIPNAAWSINFNGRAWGPIPDAVDSFFASDINDYTTYDRDLHVFRVNTGTSDALVGLYPYATNNLIVAKRRGIDLLQNIPGDLGDTFIFSIELGLAPASAQPPSIAIISDSIGVVARKAVLMVGDRLLFLSDSGGGGVYQIVPGGATAGLSVDPTPVSDPIDPLIRRINWEYAGGAVARQDGIFAHFAVPLDGCKFNNAVLTLNTATNTWHGVDFWRATPRIQSGRRQPTDDNPMRGDNLVNLNYFGVARLFAINHANGKVHLLYEGFDDQLAVALLDGREPQTYPIQDLIETRGYNTLGWNATSYRDMRRLEVQLLTNDASVDITQIINGENDERLITPARSLRPSRVDYDIWGKSAYLVTNENNDFDAPKRGDYAIFVDDQFILQDGVPLQRLAPATVRIATEARGRFTSYRIENNRGYCSILAVLQESAGDNQAERTM